MPTASEYGGFPLQPKPSDTAAKSPAGEETSSGLECTSLEPIFQQIPSLRSQLGCDVGTETKQLVNDCDQLAASISAKVKADLNSCIMPCSQSYEQCNACVKGAMQRDIDLIRPTIDKCSQKIHDQLMFIWYDLSGAMNKIGIPPLTTTDIETILAGGDIPHPVVPVADVPSSYPPPGDGTSNVPGGDVTPIYTGPITPLGQPYPPSPPQPVPIQPLPTIPPITITPPPTAVPNGGIKPPICPPGTVQIGGANGPCVPIVPPPQQPPQQPPIGPQPPGPASEGPAPDDPWYLWCDTSIEAGGVVAQSTPHLGFVPDTGIYIAGPFYSIDELANWRQQTGITPGMPCNPTTPPTPVCQQCQAGYSWSTDSNGNPVCKPSCQCPVCPTGPKPPEQPLPEPPKPAPTPSDSDRPALCGPGDKTTVEKWIDAAASEVPDDPNYKCKEGVGSWVVDLLSNVLNPLSNAQPKPFFEPLTNTMQCVANWAYINFIKPAFPEGGCDPKKATAFWVATLIPNIMDKLFGAMPIQVTARNSYISNYLCQYKIPSTDAMNTAWVHGALTNEEWEFGVKLNGDCVDWQKKIIDSSYQPISWQDAFRLKRLGDIGGNEFTKWLQNNGINTDKDQDTFEKAYAQYPAMGDLIRMMVRDSADEQAVEENGFDNEFSDKFTGKLQKWADAQGVSEDVAKMYWRAHWTLPSPGQLYEMLHRLRPNDRDPKDPFADEIVTADDVEKVLKQNDNAPEWVRSLMAISYPVLTRIDVRRGYITGALSKEQVYRAYLDLGYNETNARILLDFTTLSANPARAINDGAMSQAELARAFNDRTISDDEMANGLRLLFGDDKRAESVLDNQRFKRDIKERKAIISANRRRFMYGEFDFAKAVQELIGFGIDLDNANQLVTLWQHELAAKYKGPTIAMLCEWWTRGMITLAEYNQRVKNLGYSPEDAGRIITVCGLKDREKLAKEAEAAKKKADTAAEKRRKALEKSAMDAMPCRPVKPKCPMPGVNGSAGGKKA